MWFQSPRIKLLQGYRILGILERLNRNKPKFQLRNKMNKFSFLLQGQLQSLCKRSYLYKRNCAWKSDWRRRPSWSLTTCKSPKLVPSGQNYIYQDWHNLGSIISDSLLYNISADYSIQTSFSGTSRPHPPISLIFSFDNLFPVFIMDVLTAASSMHRKSERTTLNYRLNTKSPTM